MSQGEEVAGDPAAGAVVVAYGGAAGIVVAGATVLIPQSVRVSPETDDRSGKTLAAGRLDRGIRSPADLAIGTPWEDQEAWLGTDNGMVNLVFGDDGGGINAGRPPQAVPPREGLAISPSEDWDHFGGALAIGDLDGDDWGDLVVGVPQDGPDESGAVQVLFGALFADGFERGNDNDNGWAP